jgi:predicted metal-dependent hydrolase
MAAQVYYFKKIGNVSFVKNKRAKSLRITIKSDNKVKVTIPRNVSLTNAFRFVEEKTNWIRKSLEKIKSTNKSTVFRPGVEFCTKSHILEFHYQPETRLTARVGKGAIKIFYDTEEALVAEEGQDFIRKAIEHALRKEAKIYLPARTKFLADKFDFEFSGVRVKNLKSRWGSCSTVNNINLNIHLMRLPDTLLDYVILHELVHTVHKNHGKQFWATLDSVSGDAKTLANEMKNYRTQVY